MQENLSPFQSIDSSDECFVQCSHLADSHCYIRRFKAFLQHDQIAFISEEDGSALFLDDFLENASL